MPDRVEPQDQFKHSLATEILRSRGALRLSAFGTACLSKLWPGDRLTIRQRSIEQVLPGDVVLFARDGRFFIHRMLRKRVLNSHPQLLTRGDIMPNAHTPVSAEETAVDSTHPPEGWPRGQCIMKERPDSQD